MNRETKERIEHYKGYLPRMKEKLMAAAMMFLIAALMMGSATFAWMTLSASPEVSGIDTTVTANGNLEIALCSPDGSAPGKSAAGDSTAAGNPVTNANLTWGNLVNLSDPFYGLSNVTLRPAALNGTSGLLTNPLYGVKYGEDGRLEKMTTENDFAYTYYDLEAGAFRANVNDPHYGVRAVSTVTYTSIGGDRILAEYDELISTNYRLGTQRYLTMVTTDAGNSTAQKNMNAIAGLMQAYIQCLLDDETPKLSELNVREYIPALYDMTVQFDSVMDACGKSYLNMVNMLMYQSDGSAYQPYASVDELCNAVLSNKLPASVTKYKDKYSAIGSNYSFEKDLKAFAEDRRTIKNYIKGDAENNFSDLTDAEKKSSLAYWAYEANLGTPVYWTDVQTIINNIIGVNRATIDGYTIATLAASGSIAYNVFGNKSHSAVLVSGLIKQMEQRLGSKMSPMLSITVDGSKFLDRKGYGFMGSMYKNVKLDATVTTSATEPYEMPNDRRFVSAQIDISSIKGTDAVSEDTYAMALDLWLRTNAGSKDSSYVTTDTSVDADGNNVIVKKTNELAFLTLEGKVITQTTEKNSYITDPTDGKEYLEYTANVKFEDIDDNHSCYKKDDGKYYVAIGEDVYPFEDFLNGTYEENASKVTVTYTQVIIKETIVTGYDGENRVWDDDQMAAVDYTGTSTTQGSGSCYVFYADTPADQARFLELLKAMKVVFINSDGRQIGFANMDTENCFAQNGKVTVPLVLDKTTAIKLGTDLDGNDIYGLCELVKAKATRITALVYLDGTRLTNDMVLASGEIQGTLNIQFSTKNAVMISTTATEEGVERTTISYSLGQDSTAIKNDALMDDYVYVSASVSEKQFDFNFDPNNHPKTTVFVNVEGVEPKNVRARFIRAINSTQGSLQNEIVLAKKDGQWKGEYTFDKPGTYILRSVWVDGVEYTLENPVTVQVDGYKVTSLTCEAIKVGRAGEVMTADASYTTRIGLDFASGKGTPDRVDGIFMDESGRQVTVPLTRNSSGTYWSGKALFTSSGVYTMQYYQVDGDIYALPDDMVITLNILLGLKVQTWISCTQETLDALREVNSNATATFFTLPSELDANGVTLNVAAKIFDNNENEIKNLTGVKLRYDRAGTSLDPLDPNLTWDESEGRYIGDLHVKKLGVYSFTNVSVGNNTITNAVNAPSIQVVSPDDVSYEKNSTAPYQFAAAKDGNFVLGIKYAAGATSVVANLVEKSGATAEVNGVMSGYDESDSSIALWKFGQNSSFTEGEWTLNSITLYGVYYNKVYCDESNGGATVDLRSENITAKIVNNIYVTLVDQNSNSTLNGTFMESHVVNTMSVVIADYENAPLQNVDIKDIKVNYTLDIRDSAFADYGYTVSDKTTLATKAVVNGEGILKSGSTNEYSISGMDFKYAGDYNTCAVSLTVNGRSLTAGSSDNSYPTILRYNIGGNTSESCASYEVRWINPDAKFTAVTGKTTSRSDYRVEAHFEGSRGCYTAPSATLTLQKDTIGGNFDSAKITITSSDYSTSNPAANAVWNFTPNTLTVKSDMGAMNGVTRNSLGSNRTTDKIIISKDGLEFTMKLANVLTAHSPD